MNTDVVDGGVGTLICYRENISGSLHITNPRLVNYCLSILAKAYSKSADACTDIDTEAMTIRFHPGQRSARPVRDLIHKAEIGAFRRWVAIADLV